MQKYDHEEWRHVVGYESYEVSSHGRVRTLHSKRIMSLRKTSRGYIKVGLRTDNGKVKYCNVHRLVAMAFIGGYTADRRHVNHINAIKDDNHYKNLEWCNDRENTQHAINLGLRPQNNHGGDHALSKSVKQIDIKTGETLKIYGGVREAARACNIRVGNIQHVLVGNRNSAGGFYWKWNTNDI